MLLDHMAALIIDDARNSHIVTGPIESSAFIRGCSDCVLVVACQQLRLRDCTNIQLLLFSQTRPIIEASTGIEIGCYDFYYVGIEEHLASARLDIWLNRWEDVYDFTPSSGTTIRSMSEIETSASCNITGMNFKLMPPHIGSEDLLKPKMLSELREHKPTTLQARKLSEPTSISPPLSPLPPPPPPDSLADEIIEKRRKFGIIKTCGVQFKPKGYLC